MSFRVKIVILALIGTVLAVIIQEVNYYNLKGDFPAKKGLLTSADEASYLVPPVNFMDSGVWKDNSIGKSSYVQRPPGYGMLYFVTHLFGRENSFFILKVFQISCFFLSVFLFAFVLKDYLGLSESWTIISTIPFAILPCFNGFMYYTLSESITPFLVLLSLYSGVQFVLKNNQKWIWIYCCTAAFLILVRPQLLFVPLLITLFSLFRNRGFKGATYVWIVFVPFLMWYARTVSITKEFSSIHPIYSVTNTSLYRPIHHSLCDLFRVWEADGAQFHSIVFLLNKPDSSFDAQEVVQLLPISKRERIMPLLLQYREVQIMVQDFIQREGDIQINLQAELDLMEQLKQTRRQLINETPFEYYFATPFKSLKRLSLSSHLNLKLFQIDFRGNFWVEVLRWVCFLLILSTFICTICIAPFFALRNKDWALFGLIGFIIAYLFYLCFIQRMNEERYITPILPLMFILFVYSIQCFLKQKTNPFLLWK
jgi:hypothetical protein